LKATSAPPAHNVRVEARRAKRAQRATDGESRRRLDHVC
jgi:hypothetical protein